MPRASTATVVFNKGLNSFQTERKLPTRLALKSNSTMGVRVETLEYGDGLNVPQDGDKISVHYRGTLTDGKEICSTLKDNKPFQIKIGNGEVIKGFEEGLRQLSLGQRAKLHIPSEDAYEVSGAGWRPDGTSLIPSNADLIFEVELLKIN